MPPTEIIGWIAAVLTLLTFSARSMLALRLLAIAANISFIAYGATAAVTPVLVLHLLLFPCNLLRLYQLFADSARGPAAGTDLQVLAIHPTDARAPSGSTHTATGRDWLIVAPGTPAPEPPAAGRTACKAEHDISSEPHATLSSPMERAPRARW